MRGAKKKWSLRRSKLAVVSQEVEDDEEKQEEEEEEVHEITKNIVLADGTYATQTIASEKKKTKEEEESNLRSLLLAGDFFLGAVVCTALTKMVLRHQELAEPAEHNKRVAEVMLLCCSVIRLGRSASMPHLTIDEDSYERIVTCLRVLSEDDVVSREMFAGQCRSSFAMMMQQEQLKIAAAVEEENKADQVQADELILFRQLKNKAEGGEDEDDDVAMDIQRATGAAERKALIPCCLGALASPGALGRPRIGVAARRLAAWLEVPP